MTVSDFCHFCGRNDSLHSVPNSKRKICSICWDIMVFVTVKYLDTLPREQVANMGDISVEHKGLEIVLFKQKKDGNDGDTD